MEMRQGDSLAGRRALVIGGTGGIGRATARALAVRGAGLFLLGGSSVERLESSLEEFRRLGVSVDGRLMALERPDELCTLLPSLGVFDLLVMAFGPFYQGKLHKMGSAAWERLALLDLALPGALASALLPSMMERRWGRLLFFGGSRTDGIRAYRSNAAYAAAKTGLAVLVKSIAAEYAAYGIGAVLVCPGLVDTEYLSPERRLELLGTAPGGRLIPPDGIGEIAAALVAAEPCIASGALVSLDGGLYFPG